MVNASYKVISNTQKNLYSVINSWEEEINQSDKQKEKNKEEKCVTKIKDTFISLDETQDFLIVVETWVPHKRAIAKDPHHHFLQLNAVETPEDTF